MDILHPPPALSLLWIGTQKNVSEACSTLRNDFKYSVGIVHWSIFQTITLRQPKADGKRECGSFLSICVACCLTEFTAWRAQLCVSKIKHKQKGGPATRPPQLHLALAIVAQEMRQTTWVFVHFWAISYFPFPWVSLPEKDGDPSKEGRTWEQKLWNLLNLCKQRYEKTLNASLDAGVGALLVAGPPVWHKGCCSHKYGSVRARAHVCARERTQEYARLKTQTRYSKNVRWILCFPNRVANAPDDAKSNRFHECCHL